MWMDYVKEDEGSVIEYNLRISHLGTYIFSRDFLLRMHLVPRRLVPETLCGF